MGERVAELAGQKDLLYKSWWDAFVGCCCCSLLNKLYTPEGFEHHN